MTRAFFNAKTDEYPDGQPTLTSGWKFTLLLRDRSTRFAIVHRHHRQPKYGLWTVSDVKTGRRMIGYYPSKTSAVDVAKTVAGMAVQ